MHRSCQLIVNSGVCCRNIGRFFASELKAAILQREPQNQPFTVRLHVMQHNAYLSVRPSVYLSVPLFVKRVHCDKTKETCAHILIPILRYFTEFDSCAG